MTNSLWVTLLYFLARQSHQSCLFPWPTGGEWHFFISLPGSLINHVSSHAQQGVSDTALFLCQADYESCLSHPMTNSMWVTLIYLFVRQFYQSCLILSWATGSEWHCFIPFQAFPSIISHPMTNRKWVTLLYLPGSLIHDKQGVSDTALLYFFAHHLTIPWPQMVSLTKFSTNCKWFHCPSSCDQQSVSGVPSLPVTSLHITNREWVSM